MVAVVRGEAAKAWVKPVAVGLMEVHREGVARAAEAEEAVEAMEAEEDAVGSPQAQLVGMMAAVATEGAVRAEVVTAVEGLAVEATVVAGKEVVGTVMVAAKEMGAGVMVKEAVAMVALQEKGEALVGREAGVARQEEPGVQVMVTAEVAKVVLGAEEEEAAERVADMTVKAVMETAGAAAEVVAEMARAAVVMVMGVVEKAQAVAWPAPHVYVREFGSTSTDSSILLLHQLWCEPWPLLENRRSVNLETRVHSSCRPDSRYPGRSLI